MTQSRIGLRVHTVQDKRAKGQMRTGKHGDTGTGYQKPAVQQNTTDDDGSGRLRDSPYLYH